MPVSKCNGKWRIGDGECVYSSKAKAEAAFKHWVETNNGSWEPGDTEVIVRSVRWKISFKAVELAKDFGTVLTVSEEAFEVYDQEHNTDA